ncbi:hypothetical protein GGI06_006633, partial [Coemansia sp. S85]
ATPAECANCRGEPERSRRCAENREPTGGISSGPSRECEPEEWAEGNKEEGRPRDRLAQGEDSRRCANHRALCRPPRGDPRGRGSEVCDGTAEGQPHIQRDTEARHRGNIDEPEPRDPNQRVLATGRRDHYGDDRSGGQHQYAQGQPSENRAPPRSSGQHRAAVRPLQPPVDANLYARERNVRAGEIERRRGRGGGSQGFPPPRPIDRRQASPGEASCSPPRLQPGCPGQPPEVHACQPASETSRRSGPPYLPPGGSRGHGPQRHVAQAAPDRVSPGQPTAARSPAAAVAAAVAEPAVALPSSLPGDQTPEHQQRVTSSSSRALSFAAP